MPLTWQDSRPIGELLFEKFGDKDPLTMRFTDLHKAVAELPDFADDPKKSNDAAFWKRSKWHGTMNGRASMVSSEGGV